MSFPDLFIGEPMTCLTCHTFSVNCQDALSKQRNDTGTPPATLLCEYLTAYKIKWADNDTKMTIQNVRLHLRILRRLSMAVVDETAPNYQDSALFFFDRNEELWGRKSSEVQLQENTRSLDTSQAALPNLQDLRTASIASRKPWSHASPSTRICCLISLAFATFTKSIPSEGVSMALRLRTVLSCQCSQRRALRS